MKLGRNDLCPCGSGKKYKKCCLGKPASASDIPPELTPSQMVLARCKAFGEDDFAFIYDSYHPGSYFIDNFPDRGAYLAYGKSSLAGEFEIRECRILKEEVEQEEAKVLFYLDTLYKGERGESFELSLFYPTAGGWRYHSSQKLTREEFPGKIEEIDWEDFEKVKDKVFF